MYSHFISLTENIDTSTPMGEFFFKLMASSTLEMGRTREEIYQASWSDFLVVIHPRLFPLRLFDVWRTQLVIQEPHIKTSDESQRGLDKSLLTMLS